MFKIDPPGSLVQLQKPQFDQFPRFLDFLAQPAQFLDSGILGLEGGHEALTVIQAALDEPLQLH